MVVITFLINNYKFPIFLYIFIFNVLSKVSQRLSQNSKNPRNYDKLRIKSLQANIWPNNH